MAYLDFEISIGRRDDSYHDIRYFVEVRWRRPEDGVDYLVEEVIASECFDIDRWSCAHDPLAWGQALSRGVFSDSRVLDEFRKARIAADESEVSLRVRLLIKPSAPELHSLPWETLCDPCQDDSSVPKPLFTGPRILFSRYLTSHEWRPVRLRPQRGVRALLVIANPKDLSTYGLAAINVADELTRAKCSLSSIAIAPMEVLASEGQATLSNLKAGLYEGCDIVYLVCHGAFIEGEPCLWLEDAAGNSHKVAGDELTTEINELLQLPRLVVLVSCQSAGGEGADALTALGPRLAKIGIPAVLAFQGRVPMKTAAMFLSAFFQELRQDGELERAMAVARDKVRREPEWWMPVLFTRLHQGRIWYTVGFSGKPQDSHWPGWIRNIKAGRCTPIIGPDLFETLLGSRREIAQRWANNYNFPLASYHREDMPQVAQYLATLHGPPFPRAELRDYLSEELERRYKGDLELDGITNPQRLTLDELTQIVGKMLRKNDPADPFQSLAELPMPIYITTNVTNLLQQALIDVGKAPKTQIAPWNKSIPAPSRNDLYEPSVEQPLVYHLFGNLAMPQSWVLTEDDFFDYLIGVTRNQNRIPPRVRKALAASSLLFLGFQMEDWNFRVLLRSVLGLEGQGAAEAFEHVGVQIAPEEGRIQDPEGARRYLEQYFTKARISVFWGQAKDFLQEVSDRL